MPDFKLRMWAEQTLFDCRDYVVTAPTLEEAAALIRDVQDAVDDSGDIHITPGIVPVDRGRLNGVAPLDPSDVVAGSNGVALLDDKGERLRDLVGVPTECTRLGEPLFPVVPVETAPTLLYTLHISHKHGDSFWVFDDADKAHACLANWARQWWDKDGPRDPDGVTLLMPEFDADVVEEYFGMPGKEEYWSIGEAYLNQE